MSRESANRVLNRWRDGEIYPLHIITAALVATGDIDER